MRIEIKPLPEKVYEVGFVYKNRYKQLTLCFLFWYIDIEFKK